MSKDDRHFWIPYLSLLILVLIRLIPFFYPESRTWGFNHLIFLPAGYSIAFFSLAALALILPFLRKSEMWGDNIIQWFSFNFLESPKRYINRIIFIAIMAALFMIFSAPTHFLGDSYAYLNILDKVSGVYVEWDQTAVFKWSEIGVAKLMIMIKLIVGGYQGGGALLAFQIISVLSGIFTIWFIFLIAIVATSDKMKQIVIVASSLLSGTLLLFFGYAEYYHIIWAFHCAHIYFCLRYLKQDKGLIIVWLILIVGIVLHLQLAIFLPATLYVTAAAGKGAIIYRRYTRCIWAIFCVFSFCIVGFAIYKYATHLYIEDMFLTLFQGKPIDPGYAVFSPSHLLDLINELILISPVTVFVLMIGVINIKNIIINRQLIYFGLSAGGCLLFLFTIDPLLGMPRDWDLFSLTIYTPAIFSILLLPKLGIDSLKKFIVSILILLTIGSMPFFVTNLNRDKSTLYFEYLIELDSPKALYAIVCLADYYRSRGESKKADSLKYIFNRNYPQMRQYNQAMTAMDNGNLDLALTILNRIKQNKYDGDYQRVWGRYYYLRGDLNKALKYLNRAVQLRFYNSYYHWQRAIIYIGLSQNDKALDDLLRAYDFDNTSLRVLDGLAYLYFSAKQYDSSIYYAKEMIRIDSSQLGGYYLLANSYLKLKDYRGAYQNARQFIEKTEGRSIYNRQRAELTKMFEMIDKALKAP